MSDKNENLKPGDIYLCTDTAEYLIVTFVQKNGEYSLRSPVNAAERQKVEDAELQEKTERALDIANQAMGNKLTVGSYKVSDWTRMRVHLASAILAKMK